MSDQSTAPRELDPLTLLGCTGRGSVHIRLGYVQENGVIFPSIDGARLLCVGCVSNEGDVYYMQAEALPTERWKEGRFFVQRASAYKTDVSVGGVARTVNLNMRATKAVISDFMDIYMGCLSVAGGPVAWGITGMNILVKGGQLKRNYALYTDALQAFVSDNMELRRCMPVFYDHMYCELFLGRIEADLTGKAKDLMTEAIPAPKAVKALIGVFVGKIGEDAMKTTLSGIRDIIRDVLLKVIDHSLTKNEPISKEQVTKLASHHIVPMYAKMSRVAMRQDRAEAIIQEAVAKAALVRPRLVKIAKAIDAL